jgi:hypothetical protein
MKRSRYDLWGCQNIESFFQFLQAKAIKWGSATKHQHHTTYLIEIAKWFESKMQVAQVRAMSDENLKLIACIRSIVSEMYWCEEIDGWDENAKSKKLPIIDTIIQRGQIIFSKKRCLFCREIKHMAYDTDFEHNPGCPILKLKTTLEQIDRKTQEYKQNEASRMQSNSVAHKTTHSQRYNQDEHKCPIPKLDATVKRVDLKKLEGFTAQNSRKNGFSKVEIIPLF